MRQTKPASRKVATQKPMTVGDHLKELQWRLFVVVAVFVLLTGAAFPFFTQITDIIVRPLGDEGRLVYLTPGGAFGFMMQVCCYVGLIGSLPVIIYHLYRFIMPAIRGQSRKRVIMYTGVSFILAVAGVCFAYFLCLPAALHFLTSFNLAQISAMLTIDSYLSFVMTYLLAGAALFQLPLIMLMINTVTPLKPSQLWSVEDKIILGSFIVAAIISPTPDMLNQTMLALPVVVMYQIGFVMVVWRNRKLKPSEPPVVEDAPVPDIATPRRVESASSRSEPLLLQPQVSHRTAPLLTDVRSAPRTTSNNITKSAPKTMSDIRRPIRPKTQKISSSIYHDRRKIAVPTRQFASTARKEVAVPAQKLRRSIDGFSIV